MLRVMLAALLLAWAGLAVAQPVSLLGGGPLAGTRGGLYVATLRTEVRPAPSLFVGRSVGSLFEAPRVRLPENDVPPNLRLRGSDVEMIRQIIGYAESRRDGYDAVQHGARVKPPKPPTQMSVAQIYRWIERTPGQPHAIGRYQFIPKTLRAVMRKVGADPDQMFSPALQDQLADVLLVEAGLIAARDGQIGRRKFMNNLAKIWAGLPNTSGKSHYEGYAGNKASVSWASFEAQMKRVFPG